jgi:hypothetical protein
MNEEKRLLSAFSSIRIVENDFAFNVFKTQKIESLTHSFFFECFRSKVIFRVTQNSPAGSFEFSRKPCSARLTTSPPAPDGCLRRGRLKPKPAAPDGRNFGAFGWDVPGRIRYAFSTLPDGQCLVSCSCPF